MDLTREELTSIVGEIFATQHWLAAVCSLQFTMLSEGKEDFDAYAQSVRNSMEIAASDSQRSEFALAHLPDMLEKLDALTARIRRQIPE